MRKANSFAIILFVCLSSLLMAVETRIFDYPTEDCDPSWSPCGECMAITSDISIDNHIYLLGCDGAYQGAMIESDSEDIYPEWSPNGDYIAFNSGRSGVSKIWYKEITFTDPVQLTSGDTEEGRLCWNSQSNAIYFEARIDNEDWEICRKYLGSSDDEILQMTNDSYQDRVPVASPNGRWLAFMTDRWGDEEIAVFDLQTRIIIRLTESAGIDTPECWSPDSRWLCFYTERNGNGDIWLADMENPQSPVMTPLVESEGNDSNSCWSPDGMQIAFNSDREGTQDIWLLDVDLAANEDIQVAAPRKVSIYPNPFNPDTSIRFDLDQPAVTMVEVYDVRGRKVNTIMNTKLDAGTHTCRWDGKDYNGTTASSGIYLFRIRSGSEQWVQRAMLLK